MEFSRIQLHKPFVQFAKKASFLRRWKPAMNLEYGGAVVRDAQGILSKPRDQVVPVDDLIATGGTIEACARMSGRAWR